MTEVTMETFKEAAEEAGRRLRGEPDPKAKKEKESLRERIKAILDAGDIVVENSVRDISLKTAERIADMLWPEKSLEIKKKRAEMEVERGALLGYIRDILQEES